MDVNAEKMNFDVNSVSVGTLLGYVEDNTIAIPEIQRPYVWEAKQVRDLIDSLYKGYPIGYIITWKNPNVKLKDGSTSEGKQILIDGQQRVTALSAALLGKEVLDAEYKKKRIKISFNIKTETFDVCNPAKEKSPEWISDISRFLKPGLVNMYEFCGEYAKISGLDANTVNNRISRLLSIKESRVGRIELSSEADIDTVTEIFVRINSRGKSLSQADFVMSKISVNEKFSGNDIRKAIDYFSHFLQTPTDFPHIKDCDTDFASKDIFRKMSWAASYSDNLYKPDYSDMLRVAFTYKFKKGRLQDLVSLLSGRDFETKEYKEEIAQSSFESLYDGVKDFVNETNYNRYIMIVKGTGIINESIKRSQGVINFGYILYLLMKEKKYQPFDIEKYVMKWIVYSILTQRYSGSTETGFEYDVKRLDACGNIPEYIDSQAEAELSDAFWEKVLPDRFNTSVAGSSYWYIFLAAQIKENDHAFLSKSSTVKDLLEQRGDVHHIFPKKYLIKNGIDIKQRYNQIANYVYLQQETNIAISDRAPNQYFKELEEQINGGKQRYGCILSQDELEANLAENAIPSGIQSMEYDSYDKFLEERRKLMAEKIKKYFQSF